LIASGIAGRVTRVMIEPVEVPVADAVPLVSAIHAVLDQADLRVPRLQHGDGEATWVLLEDAVRRGIDTRIGLEDTLHLPDGSPADSNAALVKAARNLGAGQP
jgi:aminoglycoside/choline kinase family phosphotransferase